MRSGSLNDDFSITDFPGVRRFVDGPSVEALAVEEFEESILVLGTMVICQGETGHQDCDCECAEQFHSAPVIRVCVEVGNANRALTWERLEVRVVRGLGAVTKDVVIEVSRDFSGAAALRCSRMGSQKQRPGAGNAPFGLRGPAHRARVLANEGSSCPCRLVG